MNKKGKGLSAGHLTMMALGTVIGGSFFLGSSVAIHSAGPAVLISYIVSGILVYFILFALSEMTVANPSSGSFQTFATDAYGQGTGFVVGWVYWTGLILSMSSEAIAVSLLVREWIPNIHISILGSFIVIAVTLLNLLGTSALSKLESSLSGIKVITILSFIVIAALLIAGLYPGANAVGFDVLTNEAIMPGGIPGVAGSMLIVMFSYAGFEIIGLAASEAENPRDTIPKAIRITTLCLLSIYILSILALLPLIPTKKLVDDVSPMVAALEYWGIGWAGSLINIILIIAILSAMLASMFGLGRMIRSLAAEGMAPKFIADKSDVPYRGILFSGFAMLIGLGIGLLLPRVYLFLISSGGFAILFTYVIIMLTHVRFRKKNGCPPDGKCQLGGFPYSSIFVTLALIIAILSMPFIEGQGMGLVAGIVMVVFYSCCYIILKAYKTIQITKPEREKYIKRYQDFVATEFSKELNHSNIKPKVKSQSASTKPKEYEGDYDNKSNYNNKRNNVPCEQSCEKCNCNKNKNFYND